MAAALVGYEGVRLEGHLLPTLRKAPAEDPEFEDEAFLLFCSFPPFFALGFFVCVLYCLSSCFSSLVSCPCASCVWPLVGESSHR